MYQREIIAALVFSVLYWIWRHHKLSLELKRTRLLLLEVDALRRDWKDYALRPYKHAPGQEEQMDADLHELESSDESIRQRVKSEIRIAFNRSEKEEKH